MISLTVSLFYQRSSTSGGSRGIANTCVGVQKIKSLLVFMRR